MDHGTLGARSAAGALLATLLAAVALPAIAAPLTGPAAYGDWRSDAPGVVRKITPADVVAPGASPICGNSICQDRRFLANYMPELEAFFHYRNLDVSTLKELAKRWKPSALDGFKKAQAHTALADIHESIDELVHYRTTFLNLA